MFTRQLLNADPSKATTNRDPAVPNVHLADYGYGKQSVRLFQLKRDGPVHTITEYRVTAHMRLRTHKEYYNADNSDIIGSDVVETSMYMHAQKYGLRTPEEYALSFTQHLLDTYDIATDVNVIVEELGWDRLGAHESTGYYHNNPHNHVFTRTSNGRRYCEVVRKRGDPKPLVLAGIRDFRVIKTARAPFVGYKKGALFYEGDMPDRILCMDNDAKWEYSQVDGVDFTTHWHKVREAILRAIAGPPVEGVITTSVQYIAYAGANAILKNFPEICSVSLKVANYAHFPFDFSRYPPIEQKADVVINFALEQPNSIGYVQLDRTKDADETKLLKPVQ